MTAHEHAYETRIRWEGNTGAGTAAYGGYQRTYRVQVTGKADLACSADPSFRGDASRHNPEDLFLAAIAGCHMLTYLALCARRGVVVLAYEDRAEGILRMNERGGGRFESIRLHPHVMIADASMVGLARSLHDEAHGMCFIANSCDVGITHDAEIQANQLPGR